MVNDYVGIIIENNNGEFLFQLRDNNPNIKNKNKWSLFGGGVDNEESPLNAAIRELKEELGIKISKTQLKKILTITIDKQKNHIYKISLNKRTSELRLNEGSKMAYFKREDFLKQNNIVENLRLLMISYPNLRL